MTLFVELFCTPKSSMKNPSLRVSGHGSSMNRTFIVEDCAEVDFGQLATDEVTGGEQGYIDDERSCFWTWGDNEKTWQSRPFKGRPGEEKKRKNAKEKVKGDPKGPEEHSPVMNKHKILNGGQRRTLLGGPKERKARKACQKATMAFRRVVFLLYQARIKSRTMARERTKKEEARKELILNPDLQALKHTSFWMLAAQGRLDQEWQSKDSRSMHGFLTLRRNFAVVKNLSCSPTPRQKPAWKVA